ncbi:Uncharacterised protein [uncultured archaeon]|nr:Uncharacterised protein [uncultured archaeon]
MFANRKNYWSCTKFADWLRGEKKLSAGTGNEWNTWDKQAREAHPIRYWIVEEGLDQIQNLICFPHDVWDNVERYYSNRFVSHANALVASKDHIRLGQWWDVGTRILPCLFDTLQDFVEIELAWMEYISHPEKYKRSFWKRVRFGSFRDRELGLRYLDWEASLKYGINEGEDGIESSHKLYGKFTPQALAAQEIKELYTWWINIYPARPDPYDFSGWTSYCAKKREQAKKNGVTSSIAFLDTEHETPELCRERKEAMKKLRKIETDYLREDTSMLIRLIKIRDSLWT